MTLIFSGVSNCRYGRNRKGTRTRSKEDETELLQSHDKPLMDKKLLLMDEQRKCFLEMESKPGEDAVKIAE